MTAKQVIKKIKWAVSFILHFGHIHKRGFFKEGNARKYSARQTETLKDSPLAGKTIFFLGSSATKGYSAMRESFVEIIAKRNNCVCIKEAESGTCMLDDSDKSFVRRIKRFDSHAKVDAFACQLSSNDSNFYGTKKMGTISPSKEPVNFNKNTTLGAIEYIVWYARHTWHCPVVFYTGTYFNNKAYEVLLNKLYEIKDKWGIEIIDLYNDKELNNVTNDQLNLYILKDRVHPYRAGYKLWWTPPIERGLYKVVGKTQHV